MSLKNYSREELEVKSMVELANERLWDEKKAMDFNELYDQIAEFKGFTEEQKQEYIAQFYTDLTLDGRFLTVSSGVWGLKRWYPVEQMDEIVSTAPKKKKAKKKKKEEVPREEPEEGNLDVADDNVEILTGTFDDEVLGEDELDENDEFDDEFDEVDDFDDDEDDNEDDDDSNEDEDNR
ncbi:DNA-directed RNA polymerase subunit delta [Lentibacillus halodurans]|uniref:Probable DNA-directed RNA polymerase subunit delta n=1 Tax=Lentibacillus halodurans TaxID=237679 RepID=A0A1I0ZPR8_9BACI|nr:DNA-directed RNA polymerase subunit delta [Lentibacillus halodurans]SFB26133.1 DNA-directed RNA polymerase subunit delta [Lentibacillus halodurans]